MAVDDLSLGAVGGGGAVGMQDQAPFPPVNANVMMKLTQGGAIRYRGWPAVPPVPKMMDVAVRQGLAATGSFAMSGAQLDSAADSAWDGGAVPDVQDHGS